MIEIEPVTLEAYGARLEPLQRAHAEALVSAASDGRLWELRYTFVPEPEHIDAYMDEALAGQSAGHMRPWAVRELGIGAIIGSTRFHDIVAPVDRVEIGYTWYAARWQRTHLNSACKLLLLGHAFDTMRCQVVGLRTDILNRRSQEAIEALGARRDGVIRHHALRRDGSARDTVMYSILAAEWPDVRERLEARLARGARTSPDGSAGAPSLAPRTIGHHVA